MGGVCGVWWGWGGGGAWVCGGLVVGGGGVGGGGGVWVVGTWWLGGPIQRTECHILSAHRKLYAAPSLLLLLREGDRERREAHGVAATAEIRRRLGLLDSGSWGMLLAEHNSAREGRASKREADPLTTDAAEMRRWQSALSPRLSKAMSVEPVQFLRGTESLSRQIGLSGRSSSSLPRRLRR